MEQKITRQTGPILAPRLDLEAGFDRIQPLQLRRWDGGEPRLRTTARVAHDGSSLHVEFTCDHDGTTESGLIETDKPTPGLWEKDVVEIFVSDRSGGVPYREIEVSPQGEWLTLGFTGRREPASEPFEEKPKIQLHRSATQFVVAFSLPLAVLATGDDAEREWRLGLFRISGQDAERQFSSHRPTGTATPDFHQPESWARLQLLA